VLTFCDVVRGEYHAGNSPARSITARASSVLPGLSKADAVYEREAGWHARQAPPRIFYLRLWSRQ
jgi:hypothetical protein